MLNPNCSGNFANRSISSAFSKNLAKDNSSVPKDMFSAEGHDGQEIFIIPSKEIVVVVLGYSPRSHRLDFDRLLTDILKTINN